VTADTGGHALLAQRQALRVVAHAAPTGRSMQYEVDDGHSVSAAKPPSPIRSPSVVC
jgi:hypothetical protein